MTLAVARAIKGPILIIEDDPDIVELVQYNLEREGFSMVSANDGEAGLALAGQCQPILILLDLMLPSMEGLEVCRQLRQAPETRAIPLIMLTAKGDETDIVLGLGLGADDYVTKPFSPKQLTARIQAVLRRGTLKETGESRGPVVIDPTRHEVLVEGEPVLFTVPEEDRSRIFERFYRVDKARSQESGGTGLGLSIVKHYVLAMNGDVRVESQIGRGSRFIVSLPVVG